MPKPVLRPVVRPVEFRPFQGCMAAVRRLTEHVGLGSLWDGEDGISGVAADILRDLGVSEKPMPLGDGQRAVSPRIVAEKCGLLKRRKSQRRLRK